MSEGEAASWQDWVGREQQQSAMLEAGLAARLAALFDLPAPAPGAELPALWHWACFAPLNPQAELGPDGHAARGGFLPPIDLPRRMWAGSRLHFHAPLVVGAAATRTTRIAAIAEKHGATIRYIPCLLGGIFKLTGNSAPFVAFASSPLSGRP